MSKYGSNYKLFFTPDERKIVLDALKLLPVDLADGETVKELIEYIEDAGSIDEENDE